MPTDEPWRARALAAQERALPSGAAVISCPAPLDSGGLGRHLRELIDAHERAHQPHVSISARGPGAPAGPADLELGAGSLARTARPLARFSRAWRVWATMADFDREAARRLPAVEHLIAFNGAAGAQFRAARAGRWETRSLVAANPHFNRVLAQHARAHAQYPIERPWVTRLLARNLAEYARAERIYVSSEYVRDSFLQEGFEETELVRFPLTPHPRFRPSASAAASSDLFEIAYVGSLTVHKGVPLLLDALARLPHEDIRLVLVGGWTTRAMRRHLQRACARDGRITIAPGDPLPVLARARLCVHPAYEDGFAYAPAEALACGVPVIVSEDTGMKELIEPGRSGAIVATGELSALTEAIEASYRGELVRG